MALAQAYDDLFTLRRVSGLIPYFIFASGLFSLAIEDGGSQERSVRPREADGIRGGEDHGAGRPGGPPSVQTSHIKISPAAHARALLAQIGTTHIAAMTAERLLRMEITSRFTEQQPDEEMMTVLVPKPAPLPD